MGNKVSILALLTLLTCGALVAGLYRISGESLAASSVLLMVEAGLATLALYAAFFCLAYPLGKLDKYLAKRSAPAESPFASERLPTQIIAPIDRKGE
jgi:hypothetical protein